MRKFYDGIYWLFMTFCKIVFIASIVITSYVVFMRFVMSKTPRWGEQAILMCMVYMALISASLAIRTDKHLRVVLIQYLFPQKVRAKAMKVLHSLSQVTIFLFSLFMKSWLYAAVPVAGVCMLLMQSERLILFILKLMKKPVEGYYNYEVNPPEEDTVEAEVKA